MVPDATAIAQGAAFVSGAITGYPVLAAILSVFIIVGLGVYALRKIRSVAK